MTNRVTRSNLELYVVRSNLPAPLTSFVGRTREIADIKRRLAAARLLTLTGVGGCGKTRLALQVAAELETQYHDGAWFASLAPLTDPALVPQALVKILGLTEQSGRTLYDMLADYLRPRRLLLVLDNCEHLREACANLAHDLSIACPGLCILATSREPLKVPGEVTYPVPSLTLPEKTGPVSPEMLNRSEAVRLFAERAQAVQGAAPFAVTSQNAASVAQICRRLDGMPLAIELAAARVRVLSVGQIASRLDNLFQLLTRGTPELLPRHQTLRATMDWSYDLLSREERILLCRLAVFAGGCTLDAAEAICADEALTRAQILDLLSELVDKSLLTVGEHQASQARYRMLETVRQYALDKLQECGEEQALRERHRDWFLALAEYANANWRGPKQIELFDQLEAEHDNLRAALAWSKRETAAAGKGLRLAVALWRFWEVHSHFQEGRGQLAEFLALTNDAAPSALRAQALNGAGYLAMFQADYKASRAFLEASLGIAHALNDPQLVASAMYTSGVLARFRGDIGDAKRRLETSLALFRELHDRVGTYIALYNLAEAVRMEGDDARAFALHETSLALKREQGDLWAVASSLWSLAVLSLRRDDKQGAREFVTESLALFRASGDVGNCALCLGLIATILFAENRPEAATRLFGATVTHSENTGYRRSRLDLPDLDRHLEAARAQLGESRFRAAWAQGCAMTLEQAVEQGMQLVSRTGTGPALGGLVQPAARHPENRDALNERELEILRLVAGGHTNQEIADELVLALSTVKWYMSSIFAKLQIKSRTQAVARARELRLIE